NVAFREVQNAVMGIFRELLAKLHSEFATAFSVIETDVHKRLSSFPFTDWRRDILQDKFGFGGI
ncbi:hypothetical protein OFC87_33760, partial [Escherichia coli]|nr:hypothetical protein [Escherichia coli]